MQEILSAAEKRCCKVPSTGKIQWSVKLEKVLKKIRQCKLDLRYLGDTGDHGCRKNYKTEVKPVLKRLKGAKTELRTVKKKDVDLRKIQMEEQADQARKENPNSDKAKIIKQLSHQEEQMRDARRVGIALNGIQAAGINELLIPSLEMYTEEEQSMPGFNHKDIETIWTKVNVPNWREITSWEKIKRRDKVESMASKFMRKHLTQAQGTPLTTDSWDALLQSEEVQQQILMGTFEPPPDTPEPVRDYIRHLKRPTTIEGDSPFRYSLEEFKTFVKNADERTSSSPSSRHYGHWKTLRQYAPEIFEDLFTVLDIVMKYGIMLKRLLRTVMTLLKKEDMPYIHRLRPILLVEVEVQAVSSSQWAQTFSRTSEKHKIITESQYGGRKGRQAQSAVLNKLLYYDINNQYVDNYTIVDEDLKANYDRELSTLAGLEARKAGGSFQASSFMTKYIKNQEFHVKTKYGISDSFFRNESHDKMWGLGQGLAWSGESWKASSSTIDACMKEKCVGMKLVSPDGTIGVDIIMDLYIDDSAQCCNFTKNGLSLLEQTTKNLQYHSHLVYVTGGALALDKCKYYDIRHTFVKGRPKMLTTNEFESVLEVQNDFNSPKSIIKLLNFDVPHKTLGYFVSPSGNQSETIKQLTKLAQRWVNRVQQSTLKDFEILLAYESVLLRQWAYRLPGSRLSYEQCDRIMKIVTPTLLHAMHTQKNMSRVLLQPDDVYCGMEFRHLYDLAAEEKMKFLTMHIKKNDTTGKLMRISMQVSQLQIGTEKASYNLPFEKHAFLATNTWFFGLWEYWDSRLLQMDLAMDVTFSKQRENDVFLMDVLDGHFSNTDLYTINRVRIALRLLTLADVTSLNGRRFLNHIKRGETYRQSKMRWPKQPLERSWLPLWSKACDYFQRQLSKHNLGEWICSHQISKWKVSGDENFLSNGDDMYESVELRGRKIYSKMVTDGELVDAKDADIDIVKGRPRLLAMGVLSKKNHRSKFKPTNFERIFPDMEFDEHQGTKICEAFLTQNIVAANDGSVKDGAGAGAFWLATKDGDILYEYNFPVPGEHDDVHSTRTEMFAILAVLVFLKKIHARYKLENKPKLLIYTDSKNAIRKAFEPIFVAISTVFENDGDILSELKWNIQLSRFSICMQHVKAHQGDDEEVENLPLDKKLNRLMDSHAKLTFDNYHKSWFTDIPPFMAAQKISFRTPYNRLVFDIKKKINEYKIGHEAERLLANNWNIPQDHLKHIAWGTLKRVAGTLKRKNRYRAVKTVHGQWHTMSRRCRWGQSDTHICPLCNIHEETTDHVLMCPMTDVKTVRTSKLLELRKMLDKLETYPLLRNRFMCLLTQWSGGFKAAPIEMSDNVEMERLNRAFRVQMKIGTRNLFRGLLVQEIIEIQR